MFKYDFLEYYSMKSKINGRIVLSIPIILLMILIPINSVCTQIPPSYRGHVFDGANIRVGLNDYGVLGVIDEDLGEVGLQFPKGSQYESLAVGWWGDGWSVFYDEASAGFSPDDEAWGSIEDVIPEVWVTPVRDGWIKTCMLTTNDGQLEITFKFKVMPTKNFLVLVMFIKNVGSTTIKDLEVKKIVDLDTWAYYTDYDNYWGMDDIRKPSMNLAVAFINQTILSEIEKPIYLGFASRQKPTDYDLDWDDYVVRGIYEPFKVSLSYRGTSSEHFDGCLVYQWLFGKLKPGETKVLHFVYAAGNSLDELEKNVAQGFKMASTVR